MGARVEVECTCETLGELIEKVQIVTENEIFDVAVSASALEPEVHDEHLSKTGIDSHTQARLFSTDEPTNIRKQHLDLKQRFVWGIKN